MYFSVLGSEDAPQNIGGSQTNFSTLLIQGFRDKTNLISTFIIAVLTSALSTMFLRRHAYSNRILNAFTVTVIFSAICLLTIIVINTLISEITIDRYLTLIKRPLIFQCCSYLVLTIVLVHLIHLTPRYSK